MKSWDIWWYLDISGYSLKKARSHHQLYAFTAVTSQLWMGYPCLSFWMFFCWQFRWPLNAAWLECVHMGGPINGGTVSKNGRFIMDTPVRMDDLGVFRETSNSSESWTNKESWGFPLPSSSGEVLTRCAPKCCSLMWKPISLYSYIMYIYIYIYIYIHYI